MIKNYLKIAWRSLKKRKLFAAINILGLAIGFGSSIIIYLFISHHLSFDNFHNNSDRIYRFNTEEHRDNVEYEASVPPGFAKAFKEEYDYAEKVARIARMDDLVLKTEANQKFKENIVFAEEDFFSIFNFPLINGSNSIELANTNTAVLTENMAYKLYGTTDVVGKSFVLENDKTIQITGVLKNLPKATFIAQEIFISYQNISELFGFAASDSWGGISGNLQCFTLLKPNQNIANIETALLELPKKHRPKSKNKHVYKLQSLADIHFNENYGGLNPTLLWIFIITGLFLITIASINFINISTALAFYRSKEIGIRKVLGGFKAQLFWQFISETFIVSLFAVSLGVMFAVICLPFFNNLFEIQLHTNSLLDYKFIIFIISILALVSFISGSYPGVLISRVLPVLALKGKINQGDTGGKNMRKVLVVAQFTISIILIISTLIISKQIDYAVNSDLGFDKESIVMVEVPTDLNSVEINSIKQRFKGLVGVQNVSFCLSSPGAAENNWGTSVKYNNRPEKEEFSINVKVADEDYLKTFNIPLVAGRNFFKSDTITEVVVNERFAEKLGLSSSEELLGKAFEANGGDINATIVGVVRNFHDTNFSNDINPVFIAPNINWYGEIALKINHQNVKETLSQIETQWSSAFKDFIFDYRFLDDSVAKQYEVEQRYLSMSKVFSGLAIFIGCLGLYGLVLFFIWQKKKEIGVRKVLGSNVGNIVMLFTADFLKLVLIAGIIAVPIAWYLMEQWLENYTYRTKIHWSLFIIAIASTMLVAFLTISYQTIKAAMQNPVKSLRTE